MVRAKSLPGLPGAWLGSPGRVSLGDSLVACPSWDAYAREQWLWPFARQFQQYLRNFIVGVDQNECK